MSRGLRRSAEGALFTDMYQLTMAQLYHRHGLHERPAQFEYFFRSYPDYGEHQAGYAVTAGLAWLLDWLEEVRFERPDVERLRGTTGRGGAPLFDDAFLSWLEGRRVADGLSILAVPEGRVVHAGAPVAVVRGPLAHAQLLETVLLNRLNYPTLVATKAARVVQAARGGTVLDFGMRRGHERGVNAGTRAALIGGVDFSSNTGLSYALGLAPKGTHAHSMVQTFMALGMGELAAFRAYAETYPDDCLLLVDTVDTLGSGVPHAITVFEELRAAGHAPVGIRLDSGDLAHLSIQSARMLDDAGFDDATIVLSNQLDEATIWQIVTQIEEEAASYGVAPRRLVQRLSFGVGTRLIVSHGDAALDGVYKLVGVRDGAEPAHTGGIAWDVAGTARADVGWRPAVKLSDTPSKVLTPGDKRVWRLYDRRGLATADLLSAAGEDPREAQTLTLRHPSEPVMRREVHQEELSQVEPLLTQVLRDGARTLPEEDLATMRQRCHEDLNRLDPGVRRLLNPHVYHVSLTQRLWETKERLIREAAGA